MKKILVILTTILCLGTLTGCDSSRYEVVNKLDGEYTSYEDITYNEYKEKVDNKESFVVLLYQTGCSHCEEFEPKLNKVIEEYNLRIYALNLSNLTDKEYAVVKNKTFISGTPTTVSIKLGKYETKLVGNKDEQEILKFLVETEYLKEK